MPLFILAETSAGYALLKAQDRKLLKRDDLAQDLDSVEDACGLLKLKQFRKFDSASTALDEAAAVVEGKVTPMLSSMLEDLKEEKKASLVVADPKLGNAINKLPQLSITPISDSSTTNLYRAIRTHLPSLIPGLLPDDIATMSLGLSHSLSRHKLKFSPDKVDTMIIQAVSLLDDLDKELNNYAMRVKEWYGWHFPEMAKIINDNVAFARVVLHVGMRSNYSTSDMSDILPEEIEAAIKAAAEVSMGTEITLEDLASVQTLAEQVVSLTEYRQQLASYLSSRMQAIAPNLTALVGELVGARLVAHAGSLLNLAKSPGSTIQILGAEKALFRALKTKHDTPKYGLIYHASLIGQATGRNKGKVARMLASKAALSLRVDALADWGISGEHKNKEPTDEEKAQIGTSSRIYVERRLRAIEGKPLRPTGVAIGPSGQTQQPGKWEVAEARKYNKDADGLKGDEPAAAKITTAKPDPNEKAALNGVHAESDDADEDVVMEDESDGPQAKLEVAAEEADKAAAKKAKKAAKEERRAKKEEKRAKKAAKAEKAAKKEVKAEKKAKKEAEGKARETVAGAEKKRKLEDGEEASGKKKKKKH